MSEKIILKSKELIIKGIFAKKEDDLAETDYSAYSKVEILRPLRGTTEIITSDEKGRIIRNGEEVNKATSLTEIASLEMRRFYKSLIQDKYKEIEHIVILSGAGSSVGIGIENKGVSMAELWDELSKENFDCLKTLITSTKYSVLDENGNIIDKELIKDLEALLTKASLKNMVDRSDELHQAINVVREFIVSKCLLKLPDFAPHVHFLNKVLLRPQKFPRIKIFTLNYDTLFEQAGYKEKFTIIDGFTFSVPRIFNGKMFDYDIVETRHNRQDKKDSTIPKLFYLFKMHGSINWRKQGVQIEQSSENIPVEDRVIIFPQDNKYENSYEQPYFEMMARFQQTLRTENTLLITIGFSFLDKHISSVILESIKQNPSLNLIAVTYPGIIDESNTAKTWQKELHLMSEIQSRITLIAETFEEFAKQYPENKAHNKFDLLEELNESLKKLTNNGE